MNYGIPPHLALMQQIQQMHQMYQTHHLQQMQQMSMQLGPSTPLAPPVPHTPKPPCPQLPQQPPLQSFTPRVIDLRGDAPCGPWHQSLPEQITSDGKFMATLRQRVLRLRERGVDYVHCRYLLRPVQRGRQRSDFACPMSAEMHPAVLAKWSAFLASEPAGTWSMKLIGREGDSDKRYGVRLYHVTCLASDMRSPGCYWNDMQLDKGFQPRPARAPATEDGGNRDQRFRASFKKRYRKRVDNASEYQCSYQLR